MKKQLFKTLIAVILTAITFSACDSRDNLSPETKLQEDLKGKWNIEYFPLELSGKARKSNLIKPQKNVSGLFSNKNLRLTNNGTTFIEFLDSETFVIISEEGTIYGKYKVITETSVLLENFGTITDILIKENHLSFKVSFQGNQISIAANKAQQVSLTEKTKLLCRRWGLDLKQYELDNDEKFDDDYDEEIDKLEVVFSNYGTYLVTTYSQTNELIYAETANWKWIDSSENKLYYWWEDEDEGYNFITITELSSKILKITEVHEEENAIYKHTLYPLN